MDKNQKKTGIVDEPIKSADQDFLGLKDHSEALVEFIKNTDTPMTIGIQGQWGSGKTSLINSIRDTLEIEKKYKQIWINAWEASLLSSPEHSFIKILNEIIDDLIGADKDENFNKKLRSTAGKVFKNSMKISGALLAGTSGASAVDEFLGENDPGIKELRSTLEDVVKRIPERQTNPFKRIIVYVDDLDRVVPENAVQILELLKNIFNLENCIFILAIDYQVVVKGLESKFGKPNAENEREFRSFFDKIIQLPYSMPTGNYKIGEYVNRLLEDIGFGLKEDYKPGFTSEYESHLDKNLLTQIINYSIGGNPRSIKRLVNSLSLIEIFSRKTRGDEINAHKETIDHLLFCLVCIQISYPDIYELLANKPNFIEWNEDDVFDTTQGKWETDEYNKQWEIIEKNNSKDFDEEWEKNLYKICFPKVFYRNRVRDISKIFSILKDDLMNQLDSETIGEVISGIMKKTAVTSVSLNDNKKEEKTWKSVDNKELAKELWNKFIDRLEKDKKSIIFINAKRKTTSDIIRPTSHNCTFYISQFGLDMGVFIETQDIENNIKIFDYLHANKSEIETKTGLNFTWKKSEKHKRQSIRIKETDEITSFKNKYCSHKDANIPPDRNGWDIWINFMAEKCVLMEKAFILFLENYENKKN